MANLLDTLLGALGLGAQAPSTQEVRGSITYPSAPAVNVPNDPNTNYYDTITNFGNGLSPQDKQLIAELAAGGLQVDMSKLPSDHSIKALYQPGSDAYNQPVPLEDPNLPKSPLTPEAPSSYTESLRALAAPRHEGADRVNANTSNTGVRAVVDKDGKVTLTNVIGADPMAYGNGVKTIQKGNTQYDAEGNAVGEQTATLDQKRIQTGVQGLLSQIRTAPDGDTALGIYSEFTNAYAQEKAKMYNDALQTANNSLQIPVLEKQLMNEMALDRQDPENKNGLRGDSPLTMKVRAQLEQARGLADTEAKRLLAGNLHYASLESAAKNAEMEVKRITANSDRAKLIESNLTMRRLSKEEDRRDIAEQKAAGLTQDQKDRIRKLHPELQGADDVKIVATLDKHMAKKDGYAEAIDAPADMLPTLSLQGNHYAKAVLVAKEQDAGVDPALTSARLAEIDKISKDPKKLKEGLKLLTGVKEDKEVSSQLASLSAATAPGSSTAMQKQAADTRLQAARMVYAQQVQQDFTKDISSWAPTDPIFQQAVQKAQEVTGRKDLKSVMVEYAGAVTGPEREARRNQMIQYARAAASKTSGSQLGAVDSVVLSNTIQRIEVDSMIKRALSGLQLSDTNFLTPAGAVTAGAKYLTKPAIEGVQGMFSAHDK